jgi:hypothetical protein
MQELRRYARTEGPSPKQHLSDAKYGVQRMRRSRPWREHAKVRSNRRAITETTSLGCKVRCAKNAAKPAMARTNAQVVHALHVAVQVGSSGPAICVLSMYALCGIATRHEPLDRQSFQRIGDNRRLVKRTMLRSSAVAQVVQKITFFPMKSQASRNSSHVVGLATRADWRKLPARQVECELRQHGRNTTQVGRADSTPRFYFSPP